MTLASGSATSGNMKKIHTLCVYCGSGHGRNGHYSEAAATLGKAMALQRIGLVYGGASIGLMGDVARAVRENGGHVTGVIPRFLTRHELVFQDAQELIFTETMSERKHIMAERADAFVALPGGIGTLEEIVEMMTLAQLDRHAKPIVLASIDDYWKPFVALINHMRTEQFIYEEPPKVMPLEMRIARRGEDILPMALA